MQRLRYTPCVLATCCLPWNKNGSLAEETFRCEIRNLRDHLTHDLYLFGTAGEGYAVTDKQFDQITGIFREETKSPQCRPMVGVISLSLGTILERINRARSLGFRRFQISLPSWGGLNERELFRFFEAVCGGFPDCTFLHYNLLRTKRLITAAEYARLAEEFPNLTATKNATDSIDRIHQLMTQAPQLLHFFTESGYAYASSLGKCGFLISFASMNFGSARKYFDAGQRQDTGELWRMHGELERLLSDLILTTGSVAHMDGAYDQFFCKIHDPEFPLRLLPPYASFGDDVFNKFRTLVQKKYPAWSPGPATSGE